MTGQDYIKKYEAMDDDVRGNWENLWQECADWCWPTNDNINQIRSAGQEKPAQRMIDTCIEANYAFASGFFSNMFPPNVVWAKYRHPDPEMMAIPTVADYYETVSKRIHEALLSSNFAQEEFQSLLSMGCFGTNCLVVEEDDKRTIRFRNFIINKIRVAENYLGEVDTVGREICYTGRQAVQRFGEDNLKKSNLAHAIGDDSEKKYRFIHMVMPRSDFNSGSKASKDKPWASVYVSLDTKEVVKESGFDYNPYRVSRFSTGNDEIYGRGPMSMVLATTRRANVIYRSAIIGAEQHANPQWLVPDDDSVKGLSNRAGAKIKWRSSNPNGRPERLPGDTSR